MLRSPDLISHLLRCCGGRRLLPSRSHGALAGALARVPVVRAGRGRSPPAQSRGKGCRAARFCRYPPVHSRRQHRGARSAPAAADPARASHPAPGRSLGWDRPRQTTQGWQQRRLPTASSAMAGSQHCVGHRPRGAARARLGCSRQRRVVAQTCEMRALPRSPWYRHSRGMACRMALP